MHIRFRVIERWAYERVPHQETLFVSENYPDAERFCWNYGGDGELNIEKVWIRKAAPV